MLHSVGSIMQQGHAQAFELVDNYKQLTVSEATMGVTNTTAAHADCMTVTVHTLHFRQSVLRHVGRIWLCDVER